MATKARTRLLEHVPTSCTPRSGSRYDEALDGVGRPPPDQAATPVDAAAAVRAVVR